jgi:DNA-binding GntR family transcriptional regulator
MVYKNLGFVFEKVLRYQAAPVPPLTIGPDPSMVDTETARPQGESQTRAKELATTLENQILNGELKPGEQLDEANLARRFHVSRTPVREALKQLSASGLVDTRPRQRAVVAKMTIADLIYSFEIMAILEGACARFAAQRHTAEDRLAIRAAHETCRKMTEKEDPDAFYRANKEFHDAIYAASHNPLLRDQTIALRRRLEPYRRQITFHPGPMARSDLEHGHIMQAIFDMDGLAADRLMRSHLDMLSNDIAALVSALNRHHDGD